MADITNIGFARHLRSELTAHVLHYRSGRLKRSGPGLSFWLMPMGASIAEVPLDDRELTLMFHALSEDFQEVTVQGVVTYRVADPEQLARRVDFTIDMTTGRHRDQPLDRLTGTVTRLSQELASGHIVSNSLMTLLQQGTSPLRDAIHDGLIAEGSLAGMGLEIVSTRITALQPATEMERALQMPTREHIQQQADEATFARRALAVDKERAIAENELSNRIELAKREEQLIDQHGENDRRRAETAAAAKTIEVEAEAAQKRTRAAASAEATRLTEGARVEAERERMDVYANTPPSVLTALAAREMAGTLKSIEHLTITPELISPLLNKLAANGSDNGKAAKGGARR